MSDYKRLTGKDGATRVMPQWAGTSNDLKIYRRLAELEDKIENGTLVELRTKVNDTVFWITSNFEIVKVIVSIIRITKYGIVYEIEEENGCKYSMFNVEFFPTKAEAEAKLKELQVEQE